MANPVVHNQPGKFSTAFFLTSSLNKVNIFLKRTRVNGVVYKPLTSENELNRKQ